MITPGVASRPKQSPMEAVSVEHYLRLILHRKWVVITTFLVVSFATVIYTQRLPNIYTSSTLILVDPQKVPESYVKSTVTGDVRNRLGTLSQQILSFTRLQTIIDSLKLYQEEKKTLTREEIISQMRKDITTSVSSDFGSAGQDLQAFRIGYSGKDPRQVAQVVNQLASLFIDENLKAREEQSTGTTEFLDSLLQESRKNLEEQEAKVRDFKLHHIGEMPEQLPSNLQISGQLGSQLQMEGEALARAEQQKTLLQSMMSQTTPVVDVDTGEEKAPDGSQPQPKVPNAPGGKAPNKPATSPDQAKLAELLAKGYKEIHPDIIRLRRKIAEDEAKQPVAAVAAPSPVIPTPPPSSLPAASSTAIAVSPDATSVSSRPANHFNPVLQAQLDQLDAEIAKHKQEQQRLSKAIAAFQARLEVIPLREQQAADLERDIGLSKAHYTQLLDKQLSAETATQLEIRQKAQKFKVLDPALPAEKPTKPNRPMMDIGGSLAGLVLGLLFCLVPEFRGMAIIAPQDIADTGDLSMLEMIPVIQTKADRRIRKWRMIVATAVSVTAMLMLCAVIAYHYGVRI